MQVGSTNVEPENANHMLVSLNGILQKPGSSFTISGATITFASNLATGDVIDFIILLGDTLNVGTPSDDSVGAAQIKNDLISGTTALTSEPDDTDEFLVSDAGTLKRLDYSLIKASGSTPAFHAELSSNTTGLSDNSFVKVQCNTEVLDTDSAYDNSSNYRFTPGVSGKYFIYGHVLAKGGSDGCKEVRTAIYKNGSVVSQTTSGNEGEVSTGDLGISNTIGLILDSDDNDYFELYTRIDVASGNSTLVGSNGQTVFGGFKIT